MIGAGTTRYQFALSDFETHVDIISVGDLDDSQSKSKLKHEIKDLLTYISESRKVAQTLQALWAWSMTEHKVQLANEIV